MTDFIAFGLGLLLAFMLYDRMRLISWRTTKPEFVSLYLAQALWNLGILLDASRGIADTGAGIEFYQLAAIVATLIWVHLTRKGWKEGPPEHTKTAPAPLGPPEISGFQ